MLNPKNVLEIGTFTGYATLSMAEGLAEDGKIYTLDKMKILHICPQKYFDESEYNARRVYFRDAKEEIKN